MDHTFCRHLLKEVMEEVKKVTTAKDRKKTWGMKVGSMGLNRAYEWQSEIEDKEYYWSGTAHCMYEAKYQGWMEWMKNYFPEVWEGR